MSDKKNKRVVLKIKKKPLLKRLEKIFTGKTNLDVAEEQRRLNPPNTIPRGKYKHQLQNRNKIYVDPNTGEERYIEGLTKPHYSELEQFPFKDDPIFAKEQGFTQSHQFAIEAKSFNGGQFASKKLRKAGFLGKGDSF